MAMPTPSRKNVVVQMFNKPFRNIETLLPDLEQIGYSHILISPPQKSHPSEEWWGRYQPVDFMVIEGPLGDEDDLRDLCTHAGNSEIRIVVDTVLNHMANHPDYVEIRGCKVIRVKYPRYSIHDFYPIKHTSMDTLQGWMNCDLPDLHTTSTYVRNEARNYLHMLVDLGVGGFRFDAAKHIEADFFDYVLSRLQGLFLFGEFVEANTFNIGYEYLKNMDAYDFPLARTMKSAFGYGGDLRTLVNPSVDGNALSGVSAVTFVRHHDIAMHPDWFDFFRIADPIDQSLAYAYILMRRDGTPFVYLDEYNSEILKAGVAFHNLALGHGERWIVTENNRLVLQRGSELLGVINKEANTWNLIGIQTGLKPGRYCELISHGTVHIENGGVFPQYDLSGRSAGLFVKEV